MHRRTRSSSKISWPKKPTKSALIVVLLILSGSAQTMRFSYVKLVLLNTEEVIKRITPKSKTLLMSSLRSQSKTSLRLEVMLSLLLTLLSSIWDKNLKTDTTPRLLIITDVFLKVTWKTLILLESMMSFQRSSLRSARNKSKTKTLVEESLLLHHSINREKV